ncbi:LacI family DNA-binding transcriptional regulator [Glutamicibacter sp. PS]|uniref:LacI family DNA-binding transcriptional regulator n=1 Tax=Glutamicibacter sp. PS TaxID=3075634 RepID=UPI0028484148|nr:LacI family DNA-binding transcriptional regulator [Glutamicibacter sp. PS]MDR4533101.1 LacI family transcriptional regulator [Glutamicibacter sp. PS]
MAGIKDVAERAGVSIATVSRALSGRGNVSQNALEAVRRAADDLGYVVSASASGLASGRTRNIGVLLPQINHWFYAKALEGVSSALLREGFDTTLYQLTKEPQERKRIFGDFLLRQRVDAVIAINVELDESELTALHALNKPLVGVGGPLPGAPTLSLDEQALADLAVGHLRALGHERIGYLGGSNDMDLDFQLSSHRRQCFVTAMRQAELEIEPALFQGADFTMEGGYQAAKQLLGNPAAHPTALFAASDEMAIGALLAARDLGVDVPSRLSVVGIDNHDLAELFELTTIGQNPAEQGADAAKLLIDALLGRAPAEHHLAGHRLIVRGTTAQRTADFD